MKPALYGIAGILGLLGLMFLIGSQGMATRFGLGLILLLAAGGLVYVANVQAAPVDATVVRQIDVAGDVSLKAFKCQSCDAALPKEAISVEAGAIMVECPFCQTTYQVEEAPKW
ncbi:MAG TPA: hypothetical protein VLL52_09605 [Anaerolineae bacterium]|nr:hypothetical protein [Anaerolineae bacterium]